MSTEDPPRPVLLTYQLQRKGIRSTFLSGLKPIKPGQRMLGYAHTLRYMPLREDINAELMKGQNAQRRAVESMAPDEVLIMEARGEADAGTFGDIFALRSLKLGATGIITDGAVRDTPAVADLDIPVYHYASHAATFGRLHMPLEHQIPIACAGVTVMPGDIIVGDGEGAVVIPPSLVVEIAAASVVQESEEAWALERVADGESTIDTFPIAKERRPEYEAWLAQRSADATPAVGGQ
jgi:5-oxopent-3-ene-1,2,5-tricarboxylate decarboxylase / 2-hydroxyhepta-2,4-diene-1,7-dioate isomerase